MSNRILGRAVLSLIVAALIVIGLQRIFDVVEPYGPQLILVLQISSVLLPLAALVLMTPRESFHFQREPRLEELFGGRASLSAAEFGALFEDGDSAKPNLAMLLRECMQAVHGDDFSELLPDDAMRDVLICSDGDQWADWLAYRLSHVLSLTVTAAELCEPGLTVRGLVDLLLSRHRAMQNT